MEEIINIYDGKGILHLKGGVNDTFFYVRKEPKIGCFFYSDGTIHRYLIGHEIKEELIKENFQFETLVREGDLKNNISLAEQFKFILKLLTNGNYKLNFTEINYEHRLTCYSSKDGYNGYGGLKEIYATQSQFNREVVEQYKKIIQDGKRPITILFKLKDSFTSFVIDGHHKFIAYQELKINPKVLVISKLDAKEITLEEGVNLLNHLGVSNLEEIQLYKDEKEGGLYKSNYQNFYSKHQQF